MKTQLKFWVFSLLLSNIFKTLLSGSIVLHGACPRMLEYAGILTRAEKE